MVWPPSWAGPCSSPRASGGTAAPSQRRGVASNVHLHPRAGTARDGPDTGGGRPLVHGPDQRPLTRTLLLPVTRWHWQSTRGQAGRGSAHGACSATSPAAGTPTHQRAAPVDDPHQVQGAAAYITAEPMELGRTCHYFLGGVRVEAAPPPPTCPAVPAVGAWHLGTVPPPRRNSTPRTFSGSDSGPGSPPPSTPGGREPRSGDRRCPVSTRPHPCPFPLRAGGMVRTPTPSATSSWHAAPVGIILPRGQLKGAQKGSGRAQGAATRSR